MTDGDALEKNPNITREALESIHESLFGWAMSRCGNDRMMAEDLVQQTYVELLSGRARFNGESSLRTFVFGVVHNLARSRFRRVKARLKFVRSQRHQTEAPTVRSVVLGTDEVAADDALLWRAVSALPDRQRDVIELVFCRELTVAEAAAVMRVSAGTARVHYDRAKRALRKSLEKVRGDCP